MDSLAKITQRFIILLTISLLLLLSDNLKLLYLPKSLFLSITAPATLAVYKASQNFKDAFGFLTFFKSGYQQIEFLKQRNRELLVEAQKTRDLTRENNILKSQFAQTPAFSPRLLPAGVIGFDRYLILDKGSASRVKSGQAVLINNFLVGEINRVYLNQSSVMLITDPLSKIAVISSQNRSKGILQGTFGTGMVLNNVQTGDSLNKEETLETWGDVNFPAGLLTGKIAGITNKASELFKSAEVEPLVDFNKLTTVFILLN
ncbi:MAG: rod shape-determining protein MreC [Patescibacteria group bacterium]|nr:rod shape-determining protein MreC [Patescibacteria group bacterium]